MSGSLAFATTAEATWAWCGAEVRAATDLTSGREFASLGERDRQSKALTSQQAWLQSLLAYEGAVVELRWINDPSSGFVRLYLLGRVHAGDEPAAARAATDLRRRLLSAPDQVLTNAIDQRQLLAVLDPLRPDAGGMAEVRKWAVEAVPTRPDARTSAYYAVYPFRATTLPWNELLGAMAGHPHRFVLSVALQIEEVDARLPQELDRYATFFGRLALEGELSGAGLHGGRTRLAPEAFARDGERLYRDAARRYRGRAFGMRIAIASDGPLDDGILNLVGSTISPLERAADETVITSELSGLGYRIVRPGDPVQVDTFLKNLTTTGLVDWGERQPPPDFEHAARCVRLVDAREASAAFRLPIAANGALPGFRVRRPDFAVGVAVEMPSEGLDLGDQMIGRRSAGPVRIPVDDLTTHAFVVGTTGSGKTSTVLRMCDELWREHRRPFLVIEPVNTIGNDYRWFLGREGFPTSRVFTAGNDDVAPLRVNPFEVPAGVRVGAHLSNLLACFDAAFGLWDPLPAIYRQALQQTYFEAGWSLDDDGGTHGDWPTLRALIAEMRTATADLEYSGEVLSNIIAASRVRVEQLAAGACRSVFDCERSTPLDELLEHPTVVELGWLGAGNEQEVALVMALLLTGISEHRRAMPPTRSLRHVIVVEEAHKLLRRPTSAGSDRTQGDASGAAASLFAGLLAEIRKYGEGIIVADQDPAKLVPDAYKNTNLKVMHRLPDEDDRRMVGATMRFDPDHLREAAALTRFRAFVHFEGADRPALVAVPNIRAQEAEAQPGERPLASDADVRHRFDELRRASPRLDRATRPYRECDGCTHVCAFRMRSFAMSSRRTVKERFAGLMDEHAGGLDADRVAPWWAEVDDVIGELRPPHLDTAEAVDADVCLLMHLARWWWVGDRMPWVAAFRQRRTSAGDR